MLCGLNCGWSSHVLYSVLQCNGYANKLKHLRRKVHFVVMSSIYGANTSSRMTQFDLKGSLYHRTAGPEDKVLKDRDALDRRVKLRVDKAKADALLDSARHDAAFLARADAVVAGDVLLDAAGICKVTDFGLAAVAPEETAGGWLTAATTSKSPSASNKRPNVSAATPGLPRKTTRFLPSLGATLACRRVSCCSARRAQHG